MYQRAIPDLIMDGIVQEVDPEMRRLRILVHDVPKRLEIPPQCAILRDCDPLKLADVRVRNRVRIRCSSAGAVLRARSIHVYNQPWLRAVS